ncbi:hypothetical protein GA0070621_4313 [Micromonospora narathiwatensis]|uniref:Uncharacterized protein n=1 Tax=Micromonospora narathiwatensis TaxID=299146 RepID=A0A1A9A7J0_9ACTN|nr:hypothetical protein GA0070621_4313 [Micromonospora narathiwatensis]
MAWGVLLAGLTWWSVRHDPPTVREQRSLDQAGPVVDRAVGELLAAVGRDGVPAIAPDQLDRGCRITPLEDGAELTRGVEVVVAGDDVGGLLQRMADRLPSQWRAGVRTSAGGPILRADAGEFVAVEGRSTGPGRALVTATTGCRPIGTGYRAPGPTGAERESAEASRALAAWGDAAGPVEVLAAPCPSGGTARTARAESAGGASDTPLAGAFRDTVGAPAVRDTADLYAARSDVAVLADRVDDRVRVAVTTGCPA